MKQNKLKSITFWIGILSVTFLAADIDVKTLTSWVVLGNALWGILSNPVTLFSVLAAWYAQYNSHDIKKLDNPFKFK